MVVEPISLKTSLNSSRGPNNHVEHEDPANPFLGASRTKVQDPYVSVCLWGPLLVSTAAVAQTPWRIQKIEPQILDSDTYYSYGVDYRTLRWIYFRIWVNIYKHHMSPCVSRPVYLYLYPYQVDLLFGCAQGSGKKSSRLNWSGV